MPDDTEALRAEVAGLRAEVERLRAALAAHEPWWRQQSGGQWPTPQPQCSCGTSVRCQKHYPADWQRSMYINPYPIMWGAGCAGVSTTVTFPDTVGGNYPEYRLHPSALTAGCAAPPQTITYSIPAGA